MCFFTRYNYPAARTICLMSQPRRHRLERVAAAGRDRRGALPGQRGDRDPGAASAFNYHPKGKGLNWRTNLYYIETRDGGRPGRPRTATPLTLPLTELDNAALVHDYATEGPQRLPQGHPSSTPTTGR